MRPQQLPTVTVDELAPDVVLLDIREDEEWRAGHIASAVHLPMNQLPGCLADRGGPITPDSAIVVICKVGSRSAYVTAWLIQNGYNAANLDGGMLAWASSGRPMVTTDGSHPHVV
jgi:rhodanese-related sulfurtransferase